MSSAEDRVAKLVANFRASGWEGKPWEEAFSIAREEPGHIADLARAFFPVGGGAPTFVNEVLALLPMEDWVPLVGDAVALQVKEPTNEHAEHVVNAASFQCPTSLAPHRSTLFGVDELYKSHLGIQIFRDADDLCIAMLRRVLGGKNTAKEPRARYRSEYVDRRMRAFAALLETRREGPIASALKEAPRFGLAPNVVDAYVELVGWTRDGGSLRRLGGRAPLHLAFPAGYLPPAPPHFMRDQQPTWVEPPRDAVLHAFGGRASVPCELCDRVAHRLIVLDPVPDGLGVATVSRLELATCLSCVGYRSSTTWTVHGDDGEALAVRGTPQGTRPELEAEALTPTAVGLVSLGPRWAKQDWAHSNSRENLNRLSGEPCFIQNAEYPPCPSCGRKCAFLLQLDDLPTVGGGEFNWGSGGLGYVFWCDACRTSMYTWQCT